MQFPANRSCPLTGEPPRKIISYVPAYVVAASNPTYREAYSEILRISPDDEFPFVESSRSFVYSGYLPPADFLQSLYEDVIDHSRTTTASMAYRQSLLDFAGAFMQLAIEEQKTRPLRLLDFGCGYGALLALLACRDVIGVGFDPSRERRKSTTASDYISVLSSEQELAEAGPFNLLVCTEVLEHVPDPRRTLRMLKSLAAPGALLALTIPQCELADVKNAFTDLDTKGYLSSVYNPWEHLQYFTAASIRELLSEEGFEVISDYGACADARTAITRIGRVTTSASSRIIDTLRGANCVFKMKPSTKLFCRRL